MIRVYDNSRENAVMQKAITILSHEENLSKSRREKFRRHIHSVCNPERDFYDDDHTTVGGEDLEKVTIQIKVRFSVLSFQPKNSFKKTFRCARHSSAFWRFVQ